MAERVDKPSEKKPKKTRFMCEICRCRYEGEEAEKLDYAHCGRKMTPMEVAYMSDPSPTGA
jgi:hypothetical protein